MAKAGKTKEKYLGKENLACFQLLTFNIHVARGRHLPSLITYNTGVHPLIVCCHISYFQGEYSLLLVNPQSSTLLQRR